MTDYTGQKKTLEIDAARVSPGTRVLVVDDWMETAAQMDAVTTLVEAAGGRVVGIAVLDAGENDRTRTLDRKYHLHTVNPETTF